MRQGSVWYDTCPACQGRGTIPCHECSGVGQNSDAEHAQASSQPQRTAVVRLCTCSGCACADCAGTGAVSCPACHGHGIRNTPVYAGAYY